LNERELIDRLKVGDELAFRLMVDTYRNRVFYAVLNILQDADEAENAAQDTFIQVFESISTFKEASSLSTCSSGIIPAGYQ
jgi:RNA polymerase sigma-70 factor (ECF subfamily)